MSEEQKETGEITARFRAFAESVDPEPSRSISPILVSAIVGGLVLAGIVVLLVAH